MPLGTDFALYLDGKKVRSSKENYAEILRFSVGDLPEARLKALGEGAGEEWSTDGTLVSSPMFSQGITGEVIVTVRTLTEGKSADLRRSHVFLRPRPRAPGQH